MVCTSPTKIWPKPGPEVHGPAPGTKKQFPGHLWVARLDHLRLGLYVSYLGLMTPPAPTWTRMSTQPTLKHRGNLTDGLPQPAQMPPGH